MINDYKEAVSSEYGSQLHYEFIADAAACSSLHKLRLKEISAQRWQLGRKSHPRPWSFWQFLAAGRVRDKFLWEPSPRWICTLQWKMTHSRIHGKHKLIFMGLKAKGWTNRHWISGKGELDLERVEGRYEFFQNRMYQLLK